jgi:hypothetical protein
VRLYLPPLDSGKALSGNAGGSRYVSLTKPAEHTGGPKLGPEFV